MDTATNTIAQRLPAKVDLTRIPRWLIDPTYPDVEKDIVGWFESLIFWEKWDGREDVLEEVMVATRAMAEAKYQTLTRTNALKGAVGRSIYLQLYEAHQTGWFKWIGEMSDVRELLDSLLTDAMEKDPDGGARYEIQFLIETLLPTLEALGVAKEQVLMIPQNISKARSAVAATRKLVTTLSEHPEELKEALEKELADIADPSVSVREYRQRSAERMGKTQPETPAPVNGAIFLIPGTELIVIESDRTHTIAIQQATRGIVEEMPIRDATILLKQLSQKITPKDYNMALMGIDFQNGEPVVTRGKGTQLPTQDAFGPLCLAEVGRQAFMIQQCISLVGEAWVPVYIINIKVREKDVNHFVENTFSFTSTRATDIAEKAFGKVYPARMVPREVEVMLGGKYDITPLMMWYEETQTYGLFLWIQNADTKAEE